MNHILDNIFWNSILTFDDTFSIHNKTAGVFKSDIAPFAGMEDYNTPHFDVLYDLVPSEREVVILRPTPIIIPSNWKIIQTMTLEQMVFHGFTNIKPEIYPIISPLDQTHVKAMIELTKLTNPGPFLENTILFGNYNGIFEGERLIAMAGMRLHAGQYREISAVCTHPDFKGRGYAAQLIHYLISIIQSWDCIPFLHVKNDNTGAIKLYHHLGFVTRSEMALYIIKKN